MANTCSQTDDRFICTDEPGHKYEHIAEGIDGDIVHMWPNDKD